MHPVENIRCSRSELLAGRKVVLAISGSIAAVKTVELARELVRHGADVHAVMSHAATGIIHPDALHFATGNPVVTRIGGGVEHVAWLGEVKDAADVLVVAPATANTLGKMALGIDDGPVTTMATVAFGHHRHVVVAPAMHEGMLDHPVVAQHVAALREMGVTWVEPSRAEHKAKLADIDSIVDHVIHRVHSDGPLAGKRCLVIGGATAEAVDPIRVLTNRSSGRSAVALAQELFRAGGDVTLWYGNGTAPVPAALRDHVVRFDSHAELMRLANDEDVAFDQIWMPAAISDYAPEAAKQKIPSEGNPTIRLHPVEKVIEALRPRAPDATLVAFKAESEADQLIDKARGRLERYGAQWIVGNTTEAFDSEDNDVWLIGQDGSESRFAGAKQTVLRQVVRAVAEAA